MRFYIWFEKVLDSILRMVWVSVVWIHEMRKLKKKRKLIEAIQLRPEQIREIDQLWQQAYGRKISKDWNRLYQSYTGQFDAHYFPEVFYTTKLERLMNPRHLCRALSDKNLLSIFFQATEVKIPRTFVSNAWGYLYDENHNIINPQRMLEILKDAGFILIKPSVETCSGMGISMHHIQNGIDLLSGETVYTIISKLNKNYIIQEKLVAHPDYERLYSGSINTIRVITYIANHSVQHAPLTLRMGRGGKFVDNVHAGGIMIGLTDEGFLNQTAFSESQVKHYQHPDSGVIFERYKVPSTLRIIEAAKKLHGRIPGIGIISWDFMIDPNENVVLIECNLDSQTVWAPQMVNGRSIFGDNTAAMIRLISNLK